MQGLLSMRVELLQPEDVEANPYQPRKEMDDTALEELAESIRRYGLLQPIVAVQKGGGRYQALFGMRRLEAHRAKLHRPIPAFVVPEGEYSPADFLAIAISENVQRQNLSEWEEAVAVKMLAEVSRESAAEVGRRIGKSKTWVSRRVRVADDPDLAAAVREGRLRISDAGELLARDPETRKELAERGASRHDVRAARPRVEDEKNDEWDDDGDDESGEDVPKRITNVPPLHTLISRPPEMILDQYGLGEIVARLCDDSWALRVAITRRGETMDAKVWERLREALSNLIACRMHHDGIPFDDE